MTKSLGTVEFGQFAPDLPDLGGVHAEVATNCIPRSIGYDPLPGLDNYTDALPGIEAVGAESFADTADVAYNVVAGPLRVYHRSAGAWIDISKGATDYVITQRWEFVQWNAKQAFSASLDNPLQLWDLGAGAMIDLVLTGGPVQAATMAIVRNQVLVGDVTDADGHTPNRLRWCALGQPTDWVPSSATFAGFDQLESTSGGKILRVIGGEYGIVFLDRSIWRATFTGNTVTAYQLDEVEQGIQCIAPGGIVRHAGAAWYLSEDGFRVTTGDQSVSIGDERVDRLVLADLDQSLSHKITSTVLADEQTLIFAYPGANNSEVANKLALYNISTKRWSTGEEAVHYLSRSRTPFTTLEDLDSIFGSIDDVPGSLDDGAYSGGGLQASAIRDTGEAAFFTGPPRVATIETHEQQHSAGRGTFVNEVRALVEGGDVSISIGHRDVQRDPVVYTAPHGLNAAGVSEQRADARYMRYRAVISGDWKGAIGVEPFGAPSSAR